MEHQNTNQASNLIRLEEVKNKTGLKRSTIYLYMSENRFPKTVEFIQYRKGWLEIEDKQQSAPKAIIISERCVAWFESEIDEWIDTRINKRKA